MAVTTAVLQVNSLFVKFGELAAVNNLSFKSKDGEILSIIGPNGAGKTTLFNSITGFVPKTSGEVIFNGENITHLPSHEITRRGIARTFQKKSFFPNLTVLENVLIGEHMRNQLGIVKVLTNRGIKRKESEMIEKAESMLDYIGLAAKRNLTASSLPYGEQRLLGIAIALAVQPQILFLDEPCAGSNPTEAERLMKLIKDVNDRGITLILVEHHMRFVMEVSSRILCINYGEKIYEGGPREIKECPEVIEAYLGKTEV
jgi:branched-chain amino acid transport system ATP-binding protein